MIQPNIFRGLIHGWYLVQSLHFCWIKPHDILLARERRIYPSGRNLKRSLILKRFHRAHSVPTFMSFYKAPSAHLCGRNFPGCVAVKSLNKAWVQYHTTHSAHHKAEESICKFWNCPPRLGLSTSELLQECTTIYMYSVGKPKYREFTPNEREKHIRDGLCIKLLSDV